MIRRRFINLSFKPYNIEDYLTITALENDFSVTVPSDCSYSINGGKWMKIEGGKTIPIMAGDFYCFKKESTSSIGTFKIETACKLGGNAMSMIYGDRAKGETAVYDGAFERLFMNCTGITEISNNFLPATTLADYCYDSMFRGCSSLTQAPELPATTLADYCYFEMFEGCTSLVNAPELPATTLADYCYRYMFYRCTNLSYIKMLATDISASNCLSNWVSGVSSTGTFVKSKNATWDTTPGALGYDGVPAGWTVVNDGEESGGKIENKASLSEGTISWVLMFDYPVNSGLTIHFTDGTLYMLAGTKYIDTGYPTFDKPTIESIEPSSDDMYNYTF